MSGFSFGTPTTTTANTGSFSFGAPKTTTAASTFGLAAPAATGAPTFGATTVSTAAPTLGTGSLSFGSSATTTAAAPPSFSFGAPAATTTPALSFNFAPPSATAANATTVPTLNLGLAGGLGATPGQTTAATPSLGLGGGGGNFPFGKPAATTTTLNFGTTTTSAATPFASGTGLFGKPATTTTTTAATAAATPFVGLGGIDVSSTQPKLGDSKQDIKVKETQVPEEIARTVDALKTYIKGQKTLSSDISRTSTSKLANVSSEIMNLQWSLQEISNAVGTNYNLIKIMRKETSKTIQSVEMSQRTQDTPAGLQFENTSPFQYFQNLVTKYEHDLINFRQQIALTEKHMRSLTNPQNISPDDLKRGFRQINESFISLAGRLHEIHQKVEDQKEQYLNLRKYRLRDATNVFAKLDDTEAREDVTKVSPGPTPFSNISAMSSFSKSFGNTAPGGSTAGQTAK